MNNGPFSKDPSSDYRHLQDAKTAYDRLLGLLINVDVKVYKIDKDVELETVEKQKAMQQGLTHVVWINNNLAQILNASQLTTHLFVRQAVLEQRTDLGTYSASWGGAMKSYRYVDVDSSNSNEQQLEGYSSNEVHFFALPKRYRLPEQKKAF